MNIIRRWLAPWLDSYIAQLRWENQMLKEQIEELNGRLALAERAYDLLKEQKARTA